jgi:Uma2 family endonuclease
METRNPMPATQIRPETLTYAQYVDTPLHGSYAIVDGVLHPMPAPSWKHQRILGNVFDALRAFELNERRGRAQLAPLDVVIRREPLRTRQPDALFISHERLDEIDTDAPLEIGPELVVEILSPSESARAVREKLDDFAAIGTREAWLISPEAETIQVLRLTPDGIETAAVAASGQQVASLAFPGLTVGVDDLFAD